jgi:hypothetical protein
MKKQIHLLSSNAGCGWAVAEIKPPPRWIGAVYHKKSCSCSPRRIGPPAGARPPGDSDLGNGWRECGRQNQNDLNPENVVIFDRPVMLR